MNPDLLSLLVQRANQAQQPVQPGISSMIGSMGKTNTPPELQRFINAQKIQEAYRTGGPNPMLLRAALGR